MILTRNVKCAKPDSGSTRMASSIVRKAIAISKPGSILTQAEREGGQHLKRRERNDDIITKYLQKRTIYFL